METQRLCRTSQQVKTDVHAEQDAIAYAARFGVPLDGR
jgi:deoxycytidylate deaminase